MSPTSLETLRQSLKQLEIFGAVFAHASFMKFLHIVFASLLIEAGSFGCVSGDGSDDLDDADVSQLAARATADDFATWGYSGPAQYNYRLGALNVGRAYTFAQRSRDANVAAAAARLPSKPSVSNSEWESLIKRERNAIANFTSEVTLLLGDSNTHAPYEIFARSSTATLILDEAISGDTTTGILRRLRDLNLRKMDNAGRAILSGGTNDLKGLYIVGRARPTLAEVTAVIDTMMLNKRDSISEIKRKNPNATISLATMLPARANVIPASVVRNVNARIKQLATDQGVGFIDVTTALSTNGEINPDYTTDGTHFNGRGYYRIGQKLGIIPE
jgi:lysophospholipase L1-like esterase